MACPESVKRHIAVAAIDFGTTCTGYAFCFRKNTESQIQDINADQAWLGSSEMGLQAPTAVLMDTDKRFHSFGFEAETKYNSLALKNEHSGWFYFQHFKMKLHHEKDRMLYEHFLSFTFKTEDQLKPNANRKEALCAVQAMAIVQSELDMQWDRIQDLSRDMLLEEANGKTMKAMVIFTEAIKYVKNLVLDKLKTSIRGVIGDKDIKWVITVPAIWRNSAKQFMREAASEAGIPNDQLMLALEPESAAVFCKEFAISRTEGVQGAFLRAFNPGEKYIVVDLGGGTVDTTGHEVLPDGSLKELHAATGGPWGGQLVNEAFEDFIRKMVTPDVLHRFCIEYTSDWIEFQKDFEKKKRSFSNNTEEVDIKFPVDLEELYKKEQKVDLRKRLKDDAYRGKVELLKHSLVIKPKIMLTFFDPAIHELITLVKSLLKKKELKEVSSILLVGGFSESPIVSSSVRDHFKALRVIAPGNASIAILKGAIMFGNNPRAIALRISPCTYGVHTRKAFNAAVHPENKKKQVQGRYVVDEAFDKHIRVGERVYVGCSSRVRTYVISNRRNPHVFWKVYQSDEPDPQFCDEKGCRKLGRLEIALPNDLPTNKVSMKLSMTCRGTELEATAVVVEPGESAIQCKATFDFLVDDAYGSDELLDVETEN